MLETRRGPAYRQALHTGRPGLPAGRQAGFTLVEILIVIAFFAVIGGLSLAYGIEGYRQVTFHSDRDMLVATLQRARAKAVGNICIGTCTEGKPHGVAITEDAQGNVRFTIFQGSSYGAEPAFDDVIRANPNTKRDGISEVVFAQLSGRANPSGEIVLKDATGRTSTTTVGSEGEISWTN